MLESILKCQNLLLPITQCLLVNATLSSFFRKREVDKSIRFTAHVAGP